MPNHLVFVPHLLQCLAVLISLLSLSTVSGQYFDPLSITSPLVAPNPTNSEEDRNVEASPAILTSLKEESRPFSNFLNFRHSTFEWCPLRIGMDRISQASEQAFETLPVGKRQYRRVKPEFSTSTVSAPKASSSVCIDDEPNSCEIGNEQESVGFEIKTTETGFSCDLPVDPKHFSAVIGPKGATVTDIRKKTGCNVSVPRDSKTSAIPISGPSEAAVKEAIAAVQLIVSGAQSSAPAARPRQRLEFDFFVSIPLLNARFSDELDIFHDEVKTLIKARTLQMEPRALMKANSLHFTLTMLHLHSAENVSRAEALLASLAPEILAICDHKPLEIDFGSLKTFDDAKITSANIIFAEPGPNALKQLKPIGDLIRTKFAEAGLINDPKEEARPLVLHATIANTRPNRVDATPIVSLPSARFSPFSVSEIHLSQRFSYDANGYYHCVSKIEIPNA